MAHFLRQWGKNFTCQANLKQANILSLRENNLFLITRLKHLLRQTFLQSTLAHSPSSSALSVEWLRPTVVPNRSSLWHTISPSHSEPNICSPYLTMPLTLRRAFARESSAIPLPASYILHPGEPKTTAAISVIAGCV